jgi:hypothetical protein
MHWDRKRLVPAVAVGCIACLIATEFLPIWIAVIVANVASGATYFLLPNGASDAQGS